MRRFLVSSIAAFILGTCSIFAQGLRTDTLRVEIPFRRGVPTLDMGYNGTQEVLYGFLSSIDRLNRDTSIIIHSLNILSAASPEGAVANNLLLSHQRAQSIMAFLSEHTTLSPSQIKVNSRGENWEGLFEALSCCDQPWREDALEIISGSGVLESDSFEVSTRCKRDLQSLCDGEAWEWMDENVFPELRSAGGRILVVLSPTAPSVDTVTVFRENTVVLRDTVYVELPQGPDLQVNEEPLTEEKKAWDRIPVVALRSNLLVPLMNVGIEIPLSNRFSLGADWYYPWAYRQWMNRAFPAQQHCAQALALSLEGRWWLGSAHSVDCGDPHLRLCGHSLALVAMAGYYDVGLDWKGEQGEFLAVGVDYLFGLPLGRGGVHLEFNLGLGYCVNRYRDYNVRYEGGHLIGDGPQSLRHLTVPLRAGVNLAVPIGKRRSAL